METKQFQIKDETRKRCKIVRIDDKLSRRFVPISLELFTYLELVNTIDFAVYFRVGDELVEFMRAEEFSKELLAQVSGAMRRADADVEVWVLRQDRPKVDRIFDKVRSQKMESLLARQPDLDRKVLEVFGNLSAASQLVVKGGINADVVASVKAAASYVVTNLHDSDLAISTLSRMVICDPTLYDHSASVAMLSGVIATKILPKPMSTKEAGVVAQCALYHDVGKTCVPPAVLNKPGKFTPEEFEVMKKHAEMGHDVLQALITKDGGIDPLAARVALEHHEKFAGHGYPHRRKGRFETDPEHGIHLYSRIVTIADIYSALLMKRVYKDAFESQDAIKIMAESPQDYDPDLFGPFLKAVVKSLNTSETKAGKGRILLLDEQGKLSEAKKPPAA